MQVECCICKRDNLEYNIKNSEILICLFCLARFKIVTKARGHNELLTSGFKETITRGTFTMFSNKRERCHVKNRWFGLYGKLVALLYSQDQTADILRKSENLVIYSKN